MVERRWPWVALVAMALVGCGVHGEPEKAKEAEEHAEAEEAHVTVRAEPARVGTVADTVEGLGRCEALPDHIAILTPAVEGHVHELLVTEGTLVRKGQPIVELDKAVAEADLSEKQATRDGLKASLALLQSIPRPDERRANELAVEQAKVAVEQAKATVDRIRPLRERHEVSAQQLYDAEKALELAQIQQKSAEATLKVMMIGPRPEAVAEAEGKIKTADAAVAFSRAHLNFHTIRSPIDGVLESLNCHPGQTIAIGSTIGEVVDTRQVFASVWLPPRSVAQVKVGQSARVEAADLLTAAPDASAAEEGGLVGKVAFTGRVADPQTGSYPIRVLLDNPNGRLTIGQSVRVSIILSEHQGVVQVPTAAVLDLGEGPVLNVVRDGKAVPLHPKTVGAPHDGWVAVEGTDLKANEPVVVEGGYNLPENTPVNLAEEKSEGDEKAEAKEKSEDKEKAEEKAEPEVKGKAPAEAAK